MSLLRDGVAVRADKPRFARHQQLVQVAQRRQRDLRRTDSELAQQTASSFHAATIVTMPGASST